MMESDELINALDRWAVPAMAVLLFAAGSYFFGVLIYAIVLGRFAEVAR